MMLLNGAIYMEYCNKGIVGDFLNYTVKSNVRIPKLFAATC